jgi:hypothetical protein
MGSVLAVIVNEAAAAPSGFSEQTGGVVTAPIQLTSLVGRFGGERKGLECPV